MTLTGLPQQLLHSQLSRWYVRAISQEVLLEMVSNAEFHEVAWEPSGSCKNRWADLGLPFLLLECAEVAIRTLPSRNVTG